MSRRSAHQVEIQAEDQGLRRRAIAPGLHSRRSRGNRFASSLACACDTPALRRSLAERMLAKNTAANLLEKHTPLTMSAASVEEKGCSLNGHGSGRGQKEA